MTAPKALFCPTCRKVVLAADPDFPFCSDRCRILDLGKWASGGYVISSPIHDPDLPAGQEPMIRGLALPDQVLQNLYHDNAVEFLAKVGAGFEGWG